MRVVLQGPRGHTFDTGATFRALSAKEIEGPAPSASLRRLPPCAHAHSQALPRNLTGTFEGATISCGLFQRSPLYLVFASKGRK